MLKALLFGALLASVLLSVSSEDSSAEYEVANSSATSNSRSSKQDSSSSSFEEDDEDCDESTKCKNPNEFYDPCPVLCPPQICGIDESTIQCLESPKLGDPKCQPGCRCKDGYKRNKAGVCIPKDQCPSEPSEPSCGINEVFSTCTQATCRNQKCSEKGKPVACPKIAKGFCKTGCVCQENYLRAKNGTCIQEDLCESSLLCPPQICGIDESTIQCLESPKLGDPKCQPGCRCEDGYKRNKAGVCIPKDQCRTLTCTKPNEVYEECPAKCPFRTCGIDDRLVRCAKPLEVGNPDCPPPACRCASGYFRSSNGDCVTWDECPSEPSEQSCGINEVFSTCTQATCRNEKCSEKGKPVACPRVAKGFCKTGCVCQENFLRAENGTCIQEDLCESNLKCTGPNEFFSCGGACDNVCATLSQQNQTSCPIINIKCNEMCYCESGYARDENNICVPFADCKEPTCGVNEYYSGCANGDCFGPRKCSQIGGPTICVDLIEGGCRGGCLCNKGFLRDDNDVCIPEQECNPTCGINEVFSTCTQATCRNEKCSEKGKPVACPRIAKGFCKKGCVCQENFLRAENGTCIPEDLCESNLKCTGPNEFFACGGACDNVCATLSQQNQTSCPIRNIVCNKMCYCESGYARDENNICVPFADCKAPDPTCGINEVFSTCTQATCRNQKCSEKGKPVACPKIAKGFCKTGCVCQENYLRAENGICIQEDLCESNLKCGINEYYDDCPPSCSPQLCDQSIKFNCLPSTTVCKPACRCQKGFLRNEKRICVAKNKCNNITVPITAPKCKANEVLSNCTQTECRAVSCKDRNKPVACALITEGSCNKGCVCQLNYYRADNGTCVSEDECNRIDNITVPITAAKCKANEVLSNCTQTECRAVSCKDRNKPVACALITEGSCNKGCVCQLNYYRADNGTCVSEDECNRIDNITVPITAAKCKANEVLSNCTQTECRAVSCKDRNKPVACALITEGSCNKGCVCQPNYYRADNGTCVSEDECNRIDNITVPITAAKCKANEVLSNCTQTECRAVSCKDRNKPVACALITEGSCNKGCVCQLNYYRADNGTCVSEDECNRIDNITVPITAAKCKANEVLSNCTQTECRAVSCKDRNKPVACALITEGSCNKGCVCQPNYYRADNGTCVSEDECNRIDNITVPITAAKCKANEVLSNCTQTECRAVSCKDRNKPVACALITEGSCNKGCVCQPNYYRADNGTCVSEDECNRIDNITVPITAAKCKANEVLSNCTQTECRAVSCKDRNKPVACALITEGSCNKGCVCQLNYYRADNGTCVSEDECNRIDNITVPITAAKCKANEVLSNCTQTECRAVSCKDRNKPVACALITEGSCNKGCVCQPNYYRADNGTCVSEDECNRIDNITVPITAAKCKANEVLSNCTQTECRAVSCKDRNKPVACALITEGSCNKGCVCQPNYYRADNGTCVSEDECNRIDNITVPITAAKCKANEVLSNCTQTECRAVSCKDRNKPVACALITEGSCNKGCVCQPNYYRADNGTCVSEDECNRIECPNGGFLNTCPASKCDAEYCPKDRNSPQSCISTKNCGEPRCTCGFNQKRNRKTGKCVNIADCPPFKCDGPNEEYQACPPACPGQNCSDYIKNSTCPKFGRIGIVVTCKPQCRCVKNYYRNSKGICVKGSECRKEQPIIEPTEKPVTNPDNNDAQKRLSDGIASMTTRFFKEVATSKKGENVIMSPFSVNVPLAELALYAKNKTYDQLISLFNLRSKDEIRSVFKALLASFKGVKGVDISLATKVYCNKMFPLTDRFKNDTLTVFEAPAENLDFSNSKQAAATMNEWVEKNTNGRIKDLVSPDLITTDTRLALLNAIYFKGLWKYQFNRNNTQNSDFYVSKDKKVQVPTMYQKGIFRYGVSPELNAKLLELPYENQNFTCLIVLPDINEDLTATINKFTPENIDKAISRMTKQELKMYIPRFKIETTIDLKDVLQKIGVKDSFSSKDAEFDGILKTYEPLYISAAIQKAFVEVNEEGSEAAAANAFVVGVTSAVFPRPEVIEFKAERPFVFLINYNKDIIFSGACNSP